MQLDTFLGGLEIFLVETSLKGDFAQRLPIPARPRDNNRHHNM